MIECGDRGALTPRPLTTPPIKEAKMATKNYTDVGVGSKIGRLLILEESRAKGRRVYVCQCDCGNKRTVSKWHVLAGRTTSCGCYVKDMMRAKKTIHNMCKTPTYYVWQNMRERCSSLAHKNYKDYGGRGISVCERWQNSFANFLADMGEKPKGLSLDRINNDGNYCPENCRWVDAKLQNRNKGASGLVEFRGEWRHLKEWSEVLGIDYSKLKRCLRKSLNEKAVAKLLPS